MGSMQSRLGGWIDPDGLPLGIGAAGLGMLGLVSGAFAFQWQPVPDDWPARDALAIVSAVVLLLAGLAIAARRTAAAGAGVLAFWLGLGAVALNIPVVIAYPMVGTLLVFCENGAIAAGATQLLALRAPQRVPGWLGPAARSLFGLCAILFGISHFVYVDITASMVPGWIPGHVFWAYATGVCHMAAGVAMLADVRVRLAGTLLAAMAGGFVLLLHLPRVVAAPGNRMEWTMMFVAMSIAGAAWVMRLSGRRR